jgi:hypothetical protein
MKNTLTMSTRPFVAKYVLHGKNEDKAYSLGHEKCKPTTPFAIIELFF